MLIDTHSHLYADEFKDDLDEVIQRCKTSGVEKILLPNIDVSSIDALKGLVTKDPGMFIPMMGLHPCYVKENYKEELAAIKAELFSGKYMAVGEIGMDMYWDKSTVDIQTEAFITQVQWANELGLPISVHTRECTSMVIDILKKQKCDNTGVFHCFGGTLEEAREIIDMGYCLGIGGVVTFKNSNLGEILKEVGMKNLVLETDSPYLAPVPHRGKRNESSYTQLVALKLADIFGIPLPGIEEITTTNANRIFKLI